MVLLDGQTGPFVEGLVNGRQTDEWMEQRMDKRMNGWTIDLWMEIDGSIHLICT